MRRDDYAYHDQRPPQPPVRPLWGLDRDGIPNAQDRDRDGDGVRNRLDRFPDNARRS